MDENTKKLIQELAITIANLEIENAQMRLELNELRPQRTGIVEHRGGGE